MLHRLKVLMSTTGYVIMVFEYLEKGWTWQGCRAGLECQAGLTVFQHGQEHPPNWSC